MSGSEEHAILVVDDDEPIVKNMRRVLKRKGFSRVISALNGEQGIKLLEDTRNHFFLIMSDQRMPGLSGSEFLEKSMVLSPESRRMLITGYSDFDAIVDAVNKGEIHQYISKPWNNDDLILRIKTEHDIYNRFQERKHLFNLTRHQNTKLFDVAAKQKKNLERFIHELEEKKQGVEELVQALSEAKQEAEYKEVFPGLDELLTRTITMNQKNLAEAFSISRKGVMDTIGGIARKNGITFSPGPAPSGNTGRLPEDVFDIIDQVIENVVQAVEPALFRIGSEPSTGMGIDDYTQVPDFGELAFNDGYITRGEMDMAAKELAERESDRSTGLTISTVLVEKAFLQRKDLSRLFAKLAFIQTRLLDREFAQILIEREVASKKDTDRAFRKQLNHFEDSGISTPLGDILVESDVIAPELRDEIIATQDRSGTVKPDNAPQTPSSDYGTVIDLQVSQDRTQAWIRVPESLLGTTDIMPVKALIKKRGITNGVAKDAEIREFIKNGTDPLEKFIVAQGTAPRAGKPAKIVYHFNTEYDGKGVVRDDGSIDFTDRGDSPYVKKGTVLAEKQTMEAPCNGMDIFGETLLVGEVSDADLKAGDGAGFSDDELRIIAEVSGQPSLDAAGAVSVREQYTVRGDVDFKTGNIHFNGNVLVTGTVRQGFTVECDDLTAGEVNGATILTRGDLKVSNGIVNTRVESHGNIMAKFMNNVTLFAGGNLMVTREIMGSQILISGSLNNEAGRITDSLVAARLGLSVKQVGTEKAESATIRLGTDDYIKWVAQRFDREVSGIREELDRHITEKQNLDNTYNALHVDVANQTFAQEKLNRKMEFVEKNMGRADAGEERQKAARELKEIEESITRADERIKSIFKEQDTIMQQVGACDREIGSCNDRILAAEQEKKALIDRLEKTAPVPELKVNKRIYRGTRITGPTATLVLTREMGASKFTETDTGEPDAPKQITCQVLNL